MGCIQPPPLPVLSFPPSRPPSPPLSPVLSRPPSPPPSPPPPPIPQIPSPVGDGIDPMESSDPISTIVVNPHINYYAQEIVNAIKIIKHREPGPKIKIPRDFYVTPRRQEYQRYSKTLSKALTDNAESVTNILGYMIEEMTQGEEVDIRKFSNEKHKALKCFIYLYTGCYAYKKVNYQLRSGEYEKMAPIIKVVQEELKKANENGFSRKMKVNERGHFLDLNRGINKSDRQIKYGSKLYWKGFTSTTLRRSVAQRFGKFIYKISLDTGKPHPYIIVPRDLSQYEEEEIILFPFFHFECCNIQDLQSSAIYECKQIKQ